MIHADCLLDLINCSGLRVHGCLPMHRNHAGCGIDGKIEWHTNGGHGEEYSDHLLRENGLPLGSPSIFLRLVSQHNILRSGTPRGYKSSLGRRTTVGSFTGRMLSRTLYCTLSAGAPSGVSSTSSTGPVDSLSPLGIAIPHPSLPPFPLWHRKQCSWRQQRDDDTHECRSNTSCSCGSGGITRDWATRRLRAGLPSLGATGYWRSSLLTR